ncbi:MAG: acyltransferase [Oscillospiraceae bacterium]|nr:acyltransferase [Oscillospiraceae bacterium]MBR3418650.1 acyltransferase [Oscillospiraceae bacterium]
MAKQRLIGLDLIRIISCAMVCAFHTLVHLDCYYGVFNSVIRMGAVLMTMFFMLSGFSLVISGHDTDYADIRNVITFYKKRFLGIIPIYWAALVLFIICFVRNWKEQLVLLPIELTGMQTAYTSLFETAPNGGVWFISCLVFCYLIFPYAFMCIRQLKQKQKLIMIAILAAILLYSPLFVAFMDLSSIYTNPILRCAEFLIGVLLGSLRFSEEKPPFGFMSRPWVIIAAALIYCASVTAAVRFVGMTSNYMLYSWIGLPLFCVILYGLSGVSFPKLQNSKIISYLSALSYCFFLAQLFSNRFSLKVIEKSGLESNLFKLLWGWGFCIVISLILHEGIEKPLKRFLTPIILKDSK